VLAEFIPPFGDDQTKSICAENKRELGTSPLG
jgi:hypothetical protein